MPTAWFYNHRGRLQGPFEAGKILEKIKAGELGPDDLVYQEGEDKWAALQSFPKFAKALPKETSSVSGQTAEELQWVLLERKKGKANKQLGPYSTSELKTMLARGELRLSDYVWRTGMKEWYRVQVFEDLVGDAPQDLQPPEVPDLPSELPETTQTSTVATEPVDLKEVMEISYEEVTAVEPIPEEAEGPELSAAKSDPRDEDNMETRVNYRLKPDALKRVRRSVDSGSAAIEFLRSMLEGKGARWIATGLACLLLIFVGRGVFNRVKNWSADTASAEMEVEAQEEEVRSPKRKRPQRPKKKKNPVAQVKADSAPDKPRPTATPRISATYVKLSHAPKQGKLTLKTDASKHYGATFVFTSIFAKVLGRNSYHRVLVRKDRNIDLTQLNWPRGYYRVEAKMGEFSSKATVFVGSGKAYSREMKAFKKRMTMDFMNERVAYIKIATKLVDKATVFAMILRAAGNAKAWRRDFGPWRKGFAGTNHPSIRNIGPKSRSRYVMAEMWLDLKAARRDLAVFSKSMQKKSRRTSSESKTELGRIRSRMTNLLAKAQGLSLWR